MKKGIRSISTKIVMSVSMLAFVISVGYFSTPKVEASFVGDTVVETVSTFFSKIGDSLSAFFGKVSNFGGADLFGGETPTGGDANSGTTSNSGTVGDSSGYTYSNETTGGSIVPEGVVIGSGSFALSAVDGYQAVKLTWANVAGATGYKITRYKILTSCALGGGSGGNAEAFNQILRSLIPTASAADCEELVVNGNVVGNSYTDTGLTNGDQYKYVIQGLPTTLNQTATVSPVVPRLRAPDSVLSVVFGLSGNQAKITWENVPGISSYSITRYRIQTACDTGGGTAQGEGGAAFNINMLNKFLPVANAADCEATVISNITTNSYTDTAVTVGLKYAYVIASNVNGELSTTKRSNEVLIGLYPPRTFSAQPVAGGVKLTWATINNNVVEGYKISKTVNSEFTQWSEPWLIPGGASASSLSWGQTAGSTYKFRLTSYNSGAGDSIESTVSTIVVAGLVPPASVIATAGNGVNNLSWDTVLPGQSSYLVKRLKWQDCGTGQVFNPGMLNSLLPKASAASDFCEDNSFYGGAGTTIVTNTFADSIGLVVGAKYKYAIYVKVSGQSSEEGISNEVIGGLIAPASVTATVATSGVNITWPAVAGATGYKVSRVKVLANCTTGNTTTSFLNSLISTVYAADCEETVVASNVTTASYTDTNTISGNLYKYQVTTLMGVNFSVASNFSTQVNAGLLPPTTVTANVVTSGVTVTWPTVTAATGYKVTRFKVLSSCVAGQVGGETGAFKKNLFNMLLPVANAADCEETIIATNVSTTSFTDLTVTNGSQYKYKVATLMGGNTSVVSNFSNSVIAGLIPTSNVTASVATSGVSITWTAVSGASGYKVVRYTVLNSCGTAAEALKESLFNKIIPVASAADCNETVVALNVTTNAFLDTTAVNGSQYKYNIITLIGASASTPSVLSSVVVAGLKSPVQVTASVATSGVNVSWTPISGSSGYKVTRFTVLANCPNLQSFNNSLLNFFVPKANAADCNETVVGNNITTASFLDTTVMNGSQYKYSVVTLMGANVSLTPTVSAVISPAIGLVSPTTISGMVTPSGIKVSWTPVTLPGGGYVLERKSGEGAYSTITTISNVATSSYLDLTGLVLGTKYSYRIKTTFEQSSSEYKEITSLAHGALIHGLYAPESLSASPNYISGGVDLAWPAITNGIVTGYIIERAVRTAGPNSTYLYNNYLPLETINTGTTSSYSDTNAGVGVHYRYRIKAIKQATTVGTGNGTGTGNVTE